MSTGSISLDILLNKILTDAISGGNESIRAIQKRYPSLSEKEAHEILAMVSATAQSNDDSAELVVTAPPSFALKTKPTKVTVREMLMGARKSILITGYSLSDYFAELVDCVIQKSQEGVLVKFFVNDIESQKAFDRLLKAKNSPVLQMKKNDLLENLKKHSRYKTMFKFEEDHIVISSQKEAAAFIKMLNDDIVRSELTGKEYDSSSKMLLGPVGASH